MYDFVFKRALRQVNEALKPFWHCLNLTVYVLVLNNLNHYDVVMSKIIKGLRILFVIFKVFRILLAHLHVEIIEHFY